MSRSGPNSSPEDVQATFVAILERLEQMQIRQKQTLARQVEQDKRMEIFTRKLTSQEAAFDKQLKEIRKFAAQMGVANHSEHEQRTSDIISSDEEEGHEPRQLSEEAEVRRHVPAESPATNNTVSKACEVIRIIKPLHGRDDMGVEEFIKKVQLAKNSCSEPALLLQLILAEKILDEAERSIRYTKIDTYPELFEALRTQVSIPVTVNGCRDRLRSTKQGLTESVQAFSNRFRQSHSELQYAVQSRYKAVTSRRIAIQEANEEALHIYIANLRREIGQTVLACDPKTLAAAQERAINVELWIKESQPKFMTPRSHFAPTSSQRNVRTTTSRRITEAPQPRFGPPAPIPRPPTCEHCKKTGHHQSQCYQLRNFQHRQFGKLPPRVNNLTELIPSQEDQTNLLTESTITPENSNTYDYEESMETPRDSYLTQDQE